MRIAQVAPLAESVPPRGYGGIERVVSYLTEELVSMGHDVTLYATADSRTTAKLAAVSERALRTDPNCADRMAPHVLQLERVAADAREYDVIHFHTDFHHFPLTRRLGVPHVTTLHGRLDFPELKPLYREFSEASVVSITESQRAPLPEARWEGTVYHGLPELLYEFNDRPDDYLLYLGRLSEEKRVDRAVEIAHRTGIPLKVAGKIDPIDAIYIDSVVRPLLKPPVEYLGEVGEDAKAELLANARALLFPIEWPEPFGLVLIEAMACGTPVVAFRRGSVPEVVTDGVTGFVVDSVEAAVDAVRRIESIARRRCRKEFEERFSAQRMANDYVEIYRRLVQDGPR